MKHFIYINLLGILILLGVTMPSFGGIDAIGFQWLYLSIANLIVIVLNYLIIKRRAVEIYFQILSKSKMIHFFGLFLFFSFSSFLFSENIPASIVALSEIIILFISACNFIFFFIFLGNLQNGFKLLTTLIITLLSLELIISYSSIYKDILNKGLITTGSEVLAGNTGNVNILSYAILLKIPFLFYLISSYKNNINKFIFIFLFLLSSTLVFILETRSALYLYLFISLIIILNSVAKRNYNLIIVIPIVFFLSFGITRFFSSKDDSRYFKEITNVVSNSDSSFDVRKKIYTTSLEMIKDQPFTGVGIGNWKVESLRYYKGYLEGYTVPYHSHNDFLEIASEIGILGLISYLILIYFPSFLTLKKIKFDAHNLTLLISILVFSADSLINFPLARPPVILPTILILSYFYFKTENKKYA